MLNQPSELPAYLDVDDFDRRSAPGLLIFMSAIIGLGGAVMVYQHHITRIPEDGLALCVSVALTGLFMGGVLGCVVELTWRRFPCVLVGPALGVALVALGGDIEVSHLLVKESRNAYGGSSNQVVTVRFATFPILTLKDDFPDRTSMWLSLFLGFSGASGGLLAWLLLGRIVAAPFFASPLASWRLGG